MKSDRARETDRENVQLGGAVGASSEPKVWPRPALRAPAMALTAALAILVALAACATALDSDHGKPTLQVGSFPWGPSPEGWEWE